MSRSPRLHLHDPAVETADAPAPQVVPPKPKGTGCLRVLKQMHREYVAAGGTPIYQ